MLNTSCKTKFSTVLLTRYYFIVMSLKSILYIYIYIYIYIITTLSFFVRISKLETKNEPHSTLIKKNRSFLLLESPKMN